MPVAGDAGVVRLGDERDERRGDGRVRGAAAALERVEARRDGERMPGGDHAAVGAHLRARGTHRAEPQVSLRHRHHQLAEYVRTRARP
jgi:hypothetical protein